MIEQFEQEPFNQEETLTDYSLGPESADMTLETLGTEGFAELETSTQELVLELAEAAKEAMMSDDEPDIDFEPTERSDEEVYHDEVVKPIRDFSSSLDSSVASDDEMAIALVTLMASALLKPGGPSLFANKIPSPYEDQPPRPRPAATESFGSDPTDDADSPEFITEPSEMPFVEIAWEVVDELEAA